MKNLLVICLVLLIGMGCHQQADYVMEKESNSMTGNWDDGTFTVEDDILQETTDIERYLTQLKLITRGSLIIEVTDFKKARTALDSLVKLHKGFIVEEIAGRPDDMMETKVVIKLLPEQFYDFLKNVEPLALHVVNRTIETQDVTQKYTDLESRLKAKEDVVNRYREILKGAKDVTDILTIESKMAVVLEDIESMKGQIRYYNEQIGLSTMTVNMYQYLAVKDVAQAGFFSKLGHAFTFGWNDILDVLLGLAANWHLLLFWIGLFFIVYRWIGLGEYWNAFKRKIRKEGLEQV